MGSPYSQLKALTNDQQILMYTAGTNSTPSNNKVWRDQAALAYYDHNGVFQNKLITNIFNTADPDPDVADSIRVDGTKGVLLYSRGYVTPVPYVAVGTIFNLNSEQLFLEAISGTLRTIKTENNVSEQFLFQIDHYSSLFYGQSSETLTLSGDGSDTEFDLSADQNTLIKELYYSSSSVDTEKAFIVRVDGVNLNSTQYNVQLKIDSYTDFEIIFDTAPLSASNNIVIEIQDLRYTDLILQDALTTAKQQYDNGGVNWKGYFRES